jgi:hypothetical protein
MLSFWKGGALARAAAERLSAARNRVIRFISWLSEGSFEGQPPQRLAIT